MTSSRDELIEAIKEAERMGGITSPASKLLISLSKYMLSLGQILSCDQEKNPIMQKKLACEKILDEKDRKILEGFISLTEFGRITLHKKKGAFLAGGKIACYIRKMPAIFKDAYYQDHPRTEYFVHPERLIELLISHGSKEIKNDLIEYLKDMEEKENNGQGL